MPNGFLDVGKGMIGTIGGGKSKPSGRIDIAVMQSVSRQGVVNPLVEKYGQIIVDECHHVGATSFDAILKKKTSGMPMMSATTAMGIPS